MCILCIRNIHVYCVWRHGPHTVNFAGLAVSSHHGLTSSRRTSGIVPFLKPRRVIRPFIESDIWTAWVWVIAICSTSGTFIDGKRETELLFSCTFNFIYISSCFTWAHDFRDAPLILYTYACTWLLLTFNYVLSWAVQPTYTCIPIAYCIDWYVLTHAHACSRMCHSGALLLYSRLSPKLIMTIHTGLCFSVEPFIYRDFNYN